MQPSAAAHTFLPAGHAEGWVDTFRELYRSVYTAVAAGAPPEEPDYPTFLDGHRANVLGDAIAVSNAERRWVEVPT
jgi:predicted dehydrogenase